MARTWIFVIACVMLAGCAAPPVRMAARLDCDNPGRDCNVKILPPSFPGGVCKATVDFDEVHFIRGKRNIRVVWTAPAGYGFCPQLRDGVFLKEFDKDDQFDDRGAGNPHGGGPCNRTTYTLVARNTKPRPDNPYYYNVIFHDEAGVRQCLIDPRMIND